MADFDPDELRRRQMLAPFTAEQSFPQDSDDTSAESVMAPDEDEENEEDTYAPATGAGVSGLAQLGPAAQRYASLMGQKPDAANYKPSKLRRLGAAIAGFGVGVRDPRAGVETAQSILSNPYQSAIDKWQSQVTGAQAQMGAEAEAMKQDVARQRAAAYTMSSQARQRQADANDAWRQYQQAHIAWQPTNMEDALKFEASKHPATRPTAYQEYMNNPQGYSQFVHDTAKPSTGLSLEDRLKLQNNANAAAANRQASHDARMINARKTAAKVATPQQQAQAEQLAIQQVMRTNPEYAGFVDVDAKTGRHTIKDVNKATNKTTWYGATNQTQSSLAREHYNNFLSEVGKAKRSILGNQGSSQGSWDIQPDDDNEDDQENQ